MTLPEQVTPAPRRTFFSRRFAPLVAAWIVALCTVGLVYWFESAMPAFHEVVTPIYAIILFFIAFTTWRWIRTRGKRDRRHTERRRTDRRERAKPPAPPRDS